jgi:hypothetical protein
MALPIPRAAPVTIAERLKEFEISGIFVLSILNADNSSLTFPPIKAGHS